MGLAQDLRKQKRKAKGTEKLRMPALASIAGLSKSSRSVLEKYFLPSIEYIWIEAVAVADVGNRLFFDQMQAEKPDFSLW